MPDGKRSTHSSSSNQREGHSSLSKKTKPIRLNSSGKILPKLTVKLDEPCLVTGRVGGDFVTFSLYNGEAPTQKRPLKSCTMIKPLYRLPLLRYGAGADRPRMSRRDGFEGDWVEINIDSYHDKRSAFSFTISVSGVKGDEFVLDNGNNWDPSWNPIWYARRPSILWGGSQKCVYHLARSATLMTPIRFGAYSSPAVISGRVRPGNLFRRTIPTG